MKRFGHFVALILLLSTSALSVAIRIPVDEYRVTQPVAVTLSAFGESMDIPPTGVDNSLCRPYDGNSDYKRCQTQNGNRPVLIDGEHGYNRTVLVSSENKYFYTWGKNTEPVITMVIPNNPDEWCTRSIVISCLKNTQYTVYDPIDITVNVTTTDGRERILSQVEQELKPTHITGVGTLKYNLGGCWAAREVTIHLLQATHDSLRSVYSISEVELYGTYQGSGTVTPYPSNVILPTEDTTSGASNTGTVKLAPTTQDSDAMRKSIAVPVSLAVVALIIVAVVIAVICAIVLWSRKRQRQRQENHDYEDPEKHIYMDTLHIRIPNRHLHNNNHHQNCLHRGSGDGNYMEVLMTNNPGYHPTCSLSPSMATSNPTYMKSQVRDYEAPIPTIREPQYERAVAVESHCERAITDESHYKKAITHEADCQPLDRNEHCGQERASGGGYAYVLDSSNGWHMESVESALTEITDETSTSSCSYI